MDIGNFGEYGVAIFSIAAILYIVNIFVKFLKNHIEHHNRVNQKLADMVEQLLRFLERTNRK